MRRLPRRWVLSAVPTGKQEGAPGTASPSGGRVLGLGVPVRPRRVACFTAGAHSRAFSPSGRCDGPAVSEHPGPPRRPHGTQETAPRGLAPSPLRVPNPTADNINSTIILIKG